MKAEARLGVRVDGLSKRYRHRVKGEVWAAREVSLAVQPGEFLTLLGPSGCGKTTTLRMVAGFETPDEGRVFIGERDVTALAANRRDIGFVFQNYALFPHLTVFENVAYGLRVRGKADDEIRRAVGEVLALVGLHGYEPQFSSQLSGGEQQRVALARAIVIRPGVLLFDEPLSNLDARLRLQMRHEIRLLQRHFGITTLYVTHDQEEAMAVSDRIVVMNQGRVVQVGSAEDLYLRPRSGFVARFIGRINALPAQVLAVDAGGAEVQALGQRLRVPGAAAAGMAAGQAAELMIRPEAMRVGAAAMADAPDAWPATVTECTFLGEKVELHLDCGGQHLLLLRPGGPGAALPVGARVGLSADPEAWLLLPLETAT
ncbi:MAG: ABC transporter ATP-binding protein [Proteobacteria bacterium]|nr:ABC transporter ATP-binding protein [Pseudomonadota bacterium]